MINFGKFKRSKKDGAVNMISNFKNSFNLIIIFAVLITMQDDRPSLKLRWTASLSRLNYRPALQFESIFNRKGAEYE